MPAKVTPSHTALGVGSGYTTLNEWWGAGAVLSVVNLAVLVLVGGVWWKLLGYI